MGVGGGDLDRRGREAKRASAANGISNGCGLLLLRSIEKAIFMPDLC